VTISIIQAREKLYTTPIYLLEITLKNSGPTLYFSDRNVTVSGQIYEDYLEALSDIGKELRRASSQGNNYDIVLKFKNDKYLTHDYLILIGETYPFEGATCTIKEVYLDNGTLSAVETVFVGQLDEPRNINLLNFECNISSKEFIAIVNNRR
jgi:hypothetical protein